MKMAESGSDFDIFSCSSFKPIIIAAERGSTIALHEWPRSLQLNTTHDGTE
jgi:hypothetical protein